MKKLIMRYFESKQVHSSLSSFSTSDMFVVREITRTEFKKLSGEKTISGKHGFGIVYADSDKKFYSSGRLFSFDRVSKEELLAYVVETYLLHGWTVAHPFLKSAQSAHWKDEEIAECERRTAEGYVIPEWTKDFPVAGYQGGFSDDVFLSPDLYKYVSGGGCHGFIGHSVRKPMMDSYLETQFLKLNADKSLFAMWLTSTGGRHFGDSLEGSSFTEQKKYIRENVARLVEQANKYREQDEVAA